MKVEEAREYERRYNVKLADLSNGALPLDFDAKHDDDGRTSSADGCTGLSFSASAGMLEGPGPGTLLEAIVRVRRMDELGKRKGLKVGGLDEWGPVVERLRFSSCQLDGGV